MSWIFSKRCKDALRSDKIKVSISRPVRKRISYLLETMNNRWDETNGSYNYSTTDCDKVEELLKSEHGLDKLFAFVSDESKDMKSTDLEGFIMKGISPPQIFDVLELFYNQISPDRENSFQRQLNQIFDESHLSWRMADGKIFPIDSIYIEEEILSKSIELLKESRFTGALDEFEKARVDLINKDYSGAIQNANLAVESTMKSILNMQTAKPGALYKAIIESGLIPEYYNGFLKSFEETILRSVAIMRNEEKGAGHGQGKEINEINPELAEFGVHLAGTLIYYLIKRHLSTID